MLTQLDSCLTKLLKSQIVISTLPDAIRETLQNSIDASATDIKIIVDLTRLSFVIIDNGKGISPMDLDRITERYYTSKLKSFDDLKRVKTWGFRGEALNSLSSVSNLTIISRTVKYNGVYCVKFHQGRRLDQSKLLDADNEFAKEIKGRSGTVLIIKGFFLNFPVRLEHLTKKPEAKTFEELRAIVLQCVVAYPSVCIQMLKKMGLVKHIICNYHIGNSKNDNESIIKAISSIYGIDISHNRCLELTYKQYNVKCIIGSDPVQSKTYQSIYWNKRLLKDPELFKAINKLFQNADFGAKSRKLLISNIQKSKISPKKGRSGVKLATTVGNPFTKHPVFVINITGPISVSDMTQSSDKSVYLSKHWTIVTPLVMKLCKSFLQMNGYITKNDGDYDENEILKTRSTVKSNLVMSSKMRMGKIQERELDGFLSCAGTPFQNNNNNNNKFIVENLVKRRRLISKDDLKCHHDSSNFSQSFVEITVKKNVINNCKVIKQVDTKFILVKHRSILYIIDQHACDERIRVECLLKETIERAIDPNCQLSVALKDDSFYLNLSRMDFELFETFKDQLKTWGIIFKSYDENQIQITHLPELLHPKLDINYQFIQKSLTQYVHDLHTHRKIKFLINQETKTNWYSIGLQTMPTIIQDLINSKACRSSIMFGTILNLDQCQNLIDQLRKCKRPYWCAHGRPSIVPICDLSGISISK